MPKFRNSDYKNEYLTILATQASIMEPKRFQDENKRISDFYNEVLVKCSVCKKKAVARVDHVQQQARLFCLECGYNKELSTETTVMGVKGHWQTAAHDYFGAELWLQYPFKNEVFFAYNQDHLDYLEQYIAADLREHKDRTHFTLLEKLPKFYHESKNREGLLKIIEKLRKDYRK